jgi:actin-related protein 5
MLSVSLGGGSLLTVQDVILRIQERKKRKAQLGDRKSAAAQSRMKTIATLAAEETVGTKKRKKGDSKDDGFGRDDSDWVFDSAKLSTSDSIGWR